MVSCDTQRVQMNIERSLSQVNKEDSARSDFSSAVVRGGREVYLFSTFFPKSESERELFKAKWFFPTTPRSWIKAEFSRGNKTYIFFLFFSCISFCSISSIWCPLLLVSPSNMWKMYSTMQSRWLGYHLLSHRSVLCIPADAFQNQKTILLGASEKGNENEKKWTGLCRHTNTLWRVSHWQPARRRVFPRTPGSCGRSRRAWKAAGLWQTWLAFCSVFQLEGHLEGISVAERKGEAVAKVWLGSLSWGKLSPPLTSWKCIHQLEKVRAKLLGTNPTFR